MFQKLTGWKGSPPDAVGDLPEGEGRPRGQIISDIFTERPSATDFRAASAKASAVNPSSPEGAAAVPAETDAMKAAISAA